MMNWRKLKNEWKPYDKHKKVKEEKYLKQGRGFYQKEQPTPEKKPDFEEILAHFAKASKKRYNDIEAKLKDQQATLRNQHASILNIEKQVRNFLRLLYKRLPGTLSSNIETNLRAYVLTVTTQGE